MRPISSLRNIPVKTSWLTILLALGYTTAHLSAQHEDHDHDHDHAGHPADEPDDHDEHDDHNEDSGHAGHMDVEPIQVAPAVLKEFGIHLGAVGPTVLNEQVTLPGEIKFNGEALAFITPRLAGTIQEVNARLADVVEKGAILATLESTDTLRPFSVKAPFDGTIVSYDVTPGQTVDAGTALFTVANLSTVWADLRIFQRDMGHIHEGQTVVISGGQGLEAFHGTIAYIAPTIDVHTRTGLARVIVDNQHGQWKPGQFVEGSVTIEEHPVEIGIPRSALLTHEGKTVVFVRTDEGFLPRPVTLGHHDASTFQVLEGLHPGEIVALTNAISLKAELGKASFGGHEGHVH